MDYFATPLTDEHSRAGFSCGKPALDAYIRERAAREMARDLTRCYVYCEPVPEIVGFYTLSTYTFSRTVLSNTQQRKIPETYDVPAALLGRLAVSDQHAGRGIGKSLLLDALRRSLDLAGIVGVFAVAVEAKDAGAVAFYEHFGFIPFNDDREKLFLPTKTIRKMFEGCAV